jgi:hypothetical protein
VKKEWRRLLDRLRRRGAANTSKYVSDRLINEQYPLWYAYKLTGRLLELGELTAAEEVLSASKLAGHAHPLLDKMYGSWLWCAGRRKEALTFTRKKALEWSHSTLFNLLGAMHLLSGENTKAQKFFEKAEILARKELAQTAAH